MNITELLSEHREKKRRAALLLERYQELKARAISPTSAGNYTEIKAKGTKSREDLYTEIIDTREKWQLAALDYLEIRQRLFDLINKLKDPEESEILYYRLLEDMTFTQLVKKTSASRSGLHYKVRHAMKHLKEAAEETSTPECKIK